MFPLRSHLDFPHVGSGTGIMNTQSVATAPSALGHEPNPVVAGLGADPAGSVVPAPTGDTLKRVLIVASIAAAIYFVLRHFNKGKA